MLDSEVKTQVTRYAVVGISVNIGLYLLYLVVTWLGAGHKSTMTVLYALGVLSSFAANRAWSFRYDGEGRTAFVRYLVSYLGGYLLNLTILWWGVDQMQLPHQAVQAVAIILVAGGLFLMQRYWVFAPGLTKGTT